MIMRKFKNSYQHLPYAIRLLRRSGHKHKPFWNVALAPKMSRSRLSKDRILRLKKTNSQGIQFTPVNPVLWKHLKKQSVKFYGKASSLFY
jgi:hypothetical protein